ncbi:MAG: N-acetylmuramic acid 6-phosphate etherase [Ruminococcaceae bacterium]|nr:N-acetylmuramic acid 6-phosphate etherase [Oscillospiraceae bacterium]
MLNTEKRNPNSTHIDEMNTFDMLSVIQNENLNAALAVEKALPQIEKTTDKISERFNKGGRIFYVGCGTSGRLGVLDASECPPTYGVTKDKVIGIIAGGDTALRNAVEGTEDNFELGYNDIKKFDLNDLDSVVGISVAGGAKYVLGALTAAKEANALTVGLTCNEGSKINEISDLSIITDTGAEVITGSSRMKAGSAHKMVLNMISTCVMVKNGRVLENYMIYLKPSNEKLKDRMIRIVSEIGKVSYEEAQTLLEKSDWDIRKATAI